LITDVYRKISHPLKNVAPHETYCLMRHGDEIQKIASMLGVTGR